MMGWRTSSARTTSASSGWPPPTPPGPIPRPGFRDGCWLFFGKETAGLPAAFRARFPERCLRIPMRPDARSLNLANAVAILTYEALRQLDFPQLRGEGD